MTRTVWCAHSTGWATLETECLSSTRPHTTTGCFKVCPHHKYHFMWQTERWSECLPKAGKSGCQDKHGVQGRNVRCISKCGGKTPPEEACAKFHQKPQTQRICKLRCPEDCILTEFGPWSSCKTCDVLYRTRYRRILSLPQYGGKNCTNLSESESCRNSYSCFQREKKEYSYKLGLWSTCTHVHRKISGNYRSFANLIGERTRDVYCIDEVGDTVDNR